jgi:hypothetical protein
MNEYAKTLFDEILLTSTPIGEMTFRARIFDDLCTVALLSDVEKSNVSLTNGIEYAIKRLSTRWPEITPRVIVEHYPEQYDDLGHAKSVETFDVVVACFSKPKWDPTTKAQIEALIGGKLW